MSSCNIMIDTGILYSGYPVHHSKIDGKTYILKNGVYEQVDLKNLHINKTRTTDHIRTKSYTGITTDKTTEPGDPEISKQLIEMNERLSNIEHMLRWIQDRLDRNC